MEQKTERKHVWTNTAVVCLVALLCCFLWGSAFPGIKIGYGIFDISGEQTGLQIIFAGTRFFLAGIMAVVIGSFSHKRPLFPKKTSWLPILHLSLLQTTLQYFFLLYRPGKDQWRQGIHYRGFECLLWHCLWHAFFLNRKN